MMIFSYSFRSATGDPACLIPYRNLLVAISWRCTYQSCRIPTPLPSRLDSPPVSAWLVINRYGAARFTPISHPLPKKKHINARHLSLYFSHVLGSIFPLTDVLGITYISFRSTSCSMAFGVSDPSGLAVEKWGLVVSLVAATTTGVTLPTFDQCWGFLSQHCYLV